MNTYITIPARYLMGRKTRTILTTLAVVFGVTVIFGVNLILPTFLAAIDAASVGASGQADLTVTSASGETFGMDVLDTVRGTQGVAAASPALQRQFVLPGPGAPQITFSGVDVATAEQVRQYPLTSGRFLASGDDKVAVLSQSLAQILGVTTGGTVNLPTPSGTVKLPVVGVVNIPGSDQLWMPLPAAQQLFNLPGRITAVDVAASTGTDRATLEAALQAKLGAAFDVGTARLATDALSSIQLGLAMINVVGFLALFMGAFLIFNTFRAVVVERRHDIGMLRAVGATRRTIIGLILAESAIQGIVGTAIGLLLGYGLAVLLSGGLESVMNAYFRVRVGNVPVEPGQLLLAIGMGVGVTVLAGLWPAITASRVSPLTALREQPTASAPRQARRSLIAAGILIVLGVAGLVSGNTGLATLGGLVFLTGLLVLTPAALYPTARVVEPVMRWVFSREGTIAGGNMQRNPGRAAVTVSALVIGLAVTVGTVGMFSSMIGTIDNLINKSFGADILLMPPNLALWGSDVGVSQDFETRLKQVQGIGVVSGMRFAGGKTGNAAVQILGIDPATYPKVAGLAFQQDSAADYSQLDQGRNAIVTSLFASQQGVHVGDTLQMNTPEGLKPYRIVGIGGDFLNFKVNTMYISQANMAADFHKTEDVLVMANLAPGADRDAVKAAVNNLLGDYGQLTLYWGADYRATQTAYIDAVILVIYVVMALLIIPSLLGLINTLTINVMERTREIGVLRAIGATQKQVRRMVLAESLLLGAAGTALGIVGGIVLGWLFTALMGSLAPGLVFSFPVAGILFAIVLALVVCVVASLIPARQAARVQIVRALQYE